MLGSCSEKDWLHAARKGWYSLPGMPPFHELIWRWDDWGSGGGVDGRCASVAGGWPSDDDDDDDGDDGDDGAVADIC